MPSINLPIQNFSIQKNDRSNQESFLPPQVKGFRILGKRKGSLEQITSILQEISFLFVSPDPADKNTIIALNVEFRDISNNPYLFSILYFRENSIDVVYTHNPKKSEKLRKLEILSYTLNILTFFSKLYSIEIDQLYQIVESVLTDTKEYFSLDYQELFSKYNSLEEEYSFLNKKYKSLEESKKELENQLYLLKSKNQELQTKLSQFEKYSDSVLALKIQEWITEHNGVINIVEFAKFYNVPEAKVEQILNNLVAEGYLEGSKT
ncbi:MAG: hypothetical protein ACK4J0_00720 [Candidatus Anstonellaceae archaeon]